MGGPRGGRGERRYDVQMLGISSIYMIHAQVILHYANTVVVEMRRTVSVTLPTVTVTVPPAALNPSGLTGTIAIGPGAGTVSVDVGAAAGGMLGIARRAELVGLESWPALGFAADSAGCTADSVECA
jgi:hypothetical protein